MNDIYCHTSSSSLNSANQKPYSENKSNVQLDQQGYEIKLKTCGHCKREQPISEFSQNYKGRVAKLCKSCNQWARENKRTRKEKSSLEYQCWRSRNRGAALVNSAVYRAKERGMVSDITADWAQVRIDAGVCEVTGIAFDLITPRAWNAPSLDRIDNSKGYTTTNTRVVIYALNVMMNTWGQQKILEVSNGIMNQRRKASVSLTEQLTNKLKERLVTDGSTIYKQQWKQKVTPSGIVYWAHTASARRTFDSDCTGWPTTAARGVKSNQASEEFHSKRMAMSRGKTLPEVAGWATPNTMDVLPARSKEAMERQFATARPGRTAPANLREQVHPNLYPGSTAETTNTGQLNPGLSRWLMGFPVEWCIAAIRATRKKLEK